MTHYKSNLRDLEFNLFEVFETPFGTGPYADVDAETARGVLAEVDRLARVDLAASFAEGDRTPPGFDPATHSVKIPDAFKKSFQAFMDSEFWLLDLPSAVGGTLAPRSLWWTIAEMVLGANPAIWMYSSGPSFVNTLLQEGTEEQKEWGKLFVERRWGSTMVLTEPDAGSDVGAGRTKAIPQPDGSWHIEGVKRFITSGDQDMTENIIHYVLARPVAASAADLAAGVKGGADGIVGGPGTKGLSLFIVPKFHFDPTTGELGERNGVFATNVEHKMGLKVSATCEMTFGGHGVPAKGWLLGEVHEGIRQMFLIIENARMMVGTKAISTLSTGYLNALEYAKERVQGGDLKAMTDKTAPRVTITRHPDVRRSLMVQKAYTEGLRALYIYAAQWADKARIAAAAGDEKAAKRAEKINDLLLPLVKGVGSERAFQLLGSESLQTFGGSGFLQDYPLEQYVRDSKIDSLYEGTTAIQSLDLFFRKIVRDGGKGLLAVAGEITEFLSDDNENSELKQERAALGNAAAEIQRIVGVMTGWLGEAAGGDPEAVYKVGLHSRRLLLALGDLLVGWLLQRQATVALAALNGEVSDADRAFYTGKIAAAKFFAAEILPNIGADRRIIESASTELMQLDEAAF
jgi:alkylation response protein AidB-like acyl-CoA dehydrogenase